MRVLLTRVVAGMAATVVSAGFLVGTAGPAAAAGCDRSFDTYSVVKRGSTGAKTRAVECLLHDAGYATTQNSSFESSDASRLARFQGAHSQRASGRTNAATWAALIAQGSTPSLQHGDRGSSVRRLQLSLRALGHHELTGGDYYSARTASAVKSVQRRAGLKATGKTSRSTWVVLQHGGRKYSIITGHSDSSSKKASSGNKGKKALAFAKKQVGDRYRYLAAGPNAWDCSGLTMKAWAAAGVKLPHSSSAQYHKGKKVSRSDLRPGDLVFFYSGPSHVAIYAGGGKVVHAPSPGKKVSYIKISYMPYKGARRPG